jgi:short-subunit dehydrogenase
VTYLILGGSSGLGRALAERFAEAGCSLILVSSDSRDTLALASDLCLRYGARVLGVELNLEHAAASFAELDRAVEQCLPLAGILLPAGASRDDDEPGQSHERFDGITRVNYTSICRVIDRYLPRLRERGAGLIVGFGSIAAIRGRRRNAAYAAAKRALQSYFESLWHAMSGTGIIVQFYVVGYLDTNLAFARRTLVPRAPTARLADVVFRRRERDIGRCFYPRYWFVAALIISALPRAIWRRLPI